MIAKRDNGNGGRGRSLKPGGRGGGDRRVITYLKMLISPQIVVSLETSPISMKYLHNWTCTTAAKYQQIWNRVERAIENTPKQILTTTRGCSLVMSSEVSYNR